MLADRVGADYHEITDNSALSGWGPQWQRLSQFTSDIFKQYDYVMHHDADFIWSLDAPNPFELAEGNDLCAVPDLEENARRKRFKEIMNKTLKVDKPCLKHYKYFNSGLYITSRNFREQVTDMPDIIHKVRGHKWHDQDAINAAVVMYLDGNYKDLPRDFNYMFEGEKPSTIYGWHYGARYKSKFKKENHA